MSFTKVALAGIGTSPGTSILIGDSLLHSTGIDIGSNTGVGVTIRQHGDATFTGIVTAASFSGTTGTFSGNVSVGGVLTYEDVTNIDSVGVITARSGVKIGPTAGVAGTFFADGSYVTAGVVTATTFYGSGANLTGITQVGGATGVDFNDNVKARFGTGNDLEIYHNGTDSFIDDTGAGKLVLKGSTKVEVRSSGNEDMAVFTENGAVELYHDNTKTAWTHASGFNIKGKTTSDNTELIITGNEGQPASILMSADDGDDNADHWRMYSNADNSFTLNSYAGGSYQSILKGTSSRSIELNYQGTKKFETVTGGIKVTGAYALAASSGNNPTIDNADGGNGNNLYFKTGGSLRLVVQSDGHVRPGSDNSFDLGTASDRWRNLYTTDLQLSNEGKTNDVDGTWGNYTIQEGENDLFLINNRNGKKYKFNLTEVS